MADADALSKVLACKHDKRPLYTPDRDRIIGWSCERCNSCEMSLRTEDWIRVNA